jgi:cytochrome P450
VLRLAPPVPTNGPREVRSGDGRVVAGHFVPEGTEVYVPPYVLHRDRRYFSPNPDAFWPERWLEGTAGVEELNRTAFIPFSYGPANCAGKGLARTEIKMVTAGLLRAFNVELTPEFDADAWLIGLRDYFVVEIAE